MENDGAAINAMHAFIKSVNAQRGTHLRDEQSEETDAEVLAMLKGDPDCPADVLGLAEQAGHEGAPRGLPCRALVDTQADAVSSSNSSSTILAAQVPDPDSTLPNWPRTYYARLRLELEKALGLPVTVPLLYGED